MVDLATPLVLIPLYWFLLADPPQPLSAGLVITFLVLAAAWVEGHGIHLAANAIGHLLKTQPGSALDLTEFWDERFGHYLWHSAAIGLSALIFIRSARAPVPSPGTAWSGLAAAVIYGFTLFLIGDEGGTAFLMIPFAAGMTAASWWLRRRLLASPILATFGLGNALALVLFGLWFVYWGGTLPQFSEIGLIK